MPLLFTTRIQPEVPVKIMDGASHALFVDKPQEFNRVLEEFLASLPK